jgi:hypothetical protein
MRRARFHAASRFSETEGRTLFREPRPSWGQKRAEVFAKRILDLLVLADRISGRANEYLLQYKEANEYLLQYKEPSFLGDRGQLPLQADLARKAHTFPLAFFASIS